MSNTEEVVLVNERDEAIGTADKILVHQDGRLHRAVSIFIINEAGEMLLQKRAEGKYHSPGLWTNACCSHPRPGESASDAAARRLQEELGIAPRLLPLTSLLYKAPVGNGLVEHEYDHIFTATWSGTMYPAPEEASTTMWIGRDELQAWIQHEPAAFTAWFPILLKAWEAAIMEESGPYQGWNS